MLSGPGDLLFFNLLIIDINSFLPTGVQVQTVLQRRCTISFIAVQMLCAVMFVYIFHQILTYRCKVSIQAIKNINV